MTNFRSRDLDPDLDRAAAVQVESVRFHHPDYQEDRSSVSQRAKRLRTVERKIQLSSIESAF